MRGRPENLRRAIFVVWLRTAFPPICRVVAIDKMMEKLEKHEPDVGEDGLNLLLNMLHRASNDGF